MEKKNKDDVREFVDEIIDNTNRGMFITAEIVVSDEDVTDHGWKAHEISFDRDTALENFPPQIIYFFSNLSGSFENEFDYDIDVDSDVFDIYQDEFSANISEEIFYLLKSHISEILDNYDDDDDDGTLRDFVDVSRIKDKNLKLLLKQFTDEAFPKS